MELTRRRAGWDSQPEPENEPVLSHISAQLLNWEHHHNDKKLHSFSTPQNNPRTSVLQGVTHSPLVNQHYFQQQGFATLFIP